MEKYTPEQLASLAKERPKNESDKRFVLSKEEFSKQRLDAVKQEVDALRQKYPEVLSLCLFGSMVKGTAHEGSDIDGYLFIDTSVIAEQEDVAEEQILDEETYLGHTYLTDEIAKKYVLELRSGIQEKTGLDEEGVKHIRSMPISEKIIDDQISKTQAYLEIKKQTAIGRDMYYQNIDKWQRNKPPRGSAIELLLAHEKNKPEFPKYPDPVSTGFGSMFHLDVGGGIRKYRKMFIDKLVQLGPEGEKIWEDTIQSTEMMENNLSKAEDKHYPRTLAEAVAMYGK